MARWDSSYTWDSASSIWDNPAAAGDVAVSYPLAYTVQLDLDRDATFDHASDNITCDVLSANWSNGMANSYDELSQPSRLTLVLDNSSGDYFPDNAASPYYDKLFRGVAVRVRATSGANTTTLYIGKIVNIAVTVGVYSDQTVTITAEDSMLELLDLEYAPELQVNVRVDEAIAPIFETGEIVFPYPAAFWMLDVVGASELGTNTKVFQNTQTDFQQAATTLAYIGDTSQRRDGLSAQTFIRDAVAGEAGGRFFFDARRGQFIFHGRYYDILDLTIDATLDEEDFDDAQYTYGADLANDITINYQQREIGTLEEVVYRLPTDSPIVIYPDWKKRIELPYREPDDKKATIGVYEGVRPVPRLDYVLRRNSPDGTPEYEFVTVFVEYRASKAILHVANKTGSAGYYLTELELRGKTIRTYEPNKVNSYDAQSVADHTRQARVVNALAVDDEEFAQGYADQLVEKFKEPVARFSSVMFGISDDSRATQAYNRDIGDRVRITNTQVSHDREYLIIGERHQLTGGINAKHDVTWVLEPANIVSYWILQDNTYSELGTTTRAAL